MTTPDMFDNPPARPACWCAELDPRTSGPCSVCHAQGRTERRDGPERDDRHPEDSEEADDMAFAEWGVAHAELGPEGCLDDSAMLVGDEREEAARMAAAVAYDHARALEEDRERLGRRVWP